MHKALPRQVDVVVVGTGPAALIVSYILHGHIPVYDPRSPHRDPLLHERLRGSKDLLNLDVEHLTDHFGSSRISYSTQALPINVLFDTLIRPMGDISEPENKTCIQWHYDPSKAIPHVVVGDTECTGGQWSNNPINASWDIGSLSYADMLSLPGYTFAQFYVDRYGKDLPLYLRPSRREVADYFAFYPAAVGIDDAIYTNTALSGIQRKGDGFYIASHNVHCDRLVLATGVFTSLLPPPPLLRPLLKIPGVSASATRDPVLVIGSGFSAADIIISTPASRKIIHIFKWDPPKAPSPLRACHANAYPEYAGVYRKMKLAAIRTRTPKNENRPNARRGSSTFDLSRDWNENYEGLANAEIIAVDMISGNGAAMVTFKNNSGETFTRRIGSLAYVVGRKGSLDYLDQQLIDEVCPTYDASIGVSGRDMREAANEDLEVANDVFVIGSLTGDTLIRFSYGGCVYAAGKIMDRSQYPQQKHDLRSTHCMCNKQTSNHLSGEATSSCGSRSGRSSGGSSGTGSPNRVSVKVMSGLDGHGRYLGMPADDAVDHSQTMEHECFDRRKSLAYCEKF